MHRVNRNTQLSFEENDLKGIEFIDNGKKREEKSTSEASILDQYR